MIDLNTDRDIIVMDCMFGLVGVCFDFLVVGFDLLFKQTRSRTCDYHVCTMYNV